VRPDTNSSDWTVPIRSARHLLLSTHGLDVEPLGDFKPTSRMIELDNGEHPTIAFQKVPTTWRRRGHRSDSPATPLGLSRSHLDEGEQHALAAGATKHEYQPGTTFRSISIPWPSVLSRAFERLTSLTLSTPHDETNEPAQLSIPLGEART